jgi:hypothetical protein
MVMVIKWVAVLGVLALLATCGTGASHPAAHTTGPAAIPARVGSQAQVGSQAPAGSQAPVGSRAAALALARQMLSRLIVPPGSQDAHPSPVPAPLNVPLAGPGLPYTVDLHRFVLVHEPAANAQSFLLAHVPAGMTWAGTGLAPGTSNTVTVLSVSYSPRSVASGLTSAQLGAAAMPSAGGNTLIRADASVSWFPPRSAAEHLNSATIRSVTITATQVFPRSRTVTRTFTSEAVITRLVALLDRLPATPYPDVAAMSCAPAFTGYRLEFAPNVVVDWDGCGGSDAIYVNGKVQPRLWDHGVLAAALLSLTRA